MFKKKKKKKKKEEGHRRSKSLSVPTESALLLYGRCGGPR
jgi:hypothetical protein